MALIIETTDQSGKVEQHPIDSGANTIDAQPGLRYRILDENGAAVHVNATIRRVGDHLLIEDLPGDSTVELTDFFFVCTVDEPCALELEGIGGTAGETIGPLSQPLAALADGSFVLHGPETMETPVAPEAEHAIPVRPALAGLALLAVAAGGGGGGGGGGGPPPPPPGSTGVDSRGLTNDPTPTISGEAPAGTQVTVTLEIPGSGPVTFDTSADAAGRWVVDTGAARPTSGKMPADGLPESSPTIVRVLAAGTTEPVTYELTVDRSPPGAPTLALASDTGASNTDGITRTGTIQIDGLETGASWQYSTNGGASWAQGTGRNFELAEGQYAANAIQVRQTDQAGNVGPAAGLARAITIDTSAPGAPSFAPIAGDQPIDAATRNQGITVSGTAEPGSSVAVTWGATTHTVTTEANGAWQASFAAAQIPTTSGNVTAVATDAAGNSSVAGTRPVTILNAHTTPQIAPVTQDGVINIAEHAAGVAVTGTAPGASTVTVTWGSVTHTAAVGPGGAWSVPFASGEISPAAGTISAVASGPGGSPSTPATRPVGFDLQAPTAPTITGLAQDTGTSTNDGITQVGTVNIGGLETGASWQYSTDGGTSWKPGSGTSFTLPEGAYTPGSIQVRQIDQADNHSPAAPYGAAITVDQTAPPTPGASFTPGMVVVNGIETNASWKYSIDNGQTWSPGPAPSAGGMASFQPPAGEYGAGVIQITQTDQAGNESAAASNAAPYHFADGQEAGNSTALLASIGADFTQPGAEPSARQADLAPAQKSLPDPASSELPTDPGVITLADVLGTHDLPMMPTETAASTSTAVAPLDLGPAQYGESASPVVSAGPAALLQLPDSFVF